MKLSRLYLLFIAMGSLFLASCDDDDNNSVADNGIKVLTAQTSFDANGGTYDITVNKDIVKAYAADEWLSVSPQGASVSIAAGVNESMQSRHTTLVIKASESDSTIVNVSQYGSVFSLEGLNKSIATSNSAASFTYSMKHALPVTVSASDDWIVPTVGDDNLKVELSANTTGHMRRGWLAYACGSIKDTVDVVQYDFKQNLAGDYYLAFINDEDGKLYAMQAELAQVGSSYQLTFPTEGLTLPVAFDPSTCKLTITTGTYMGPFDNQGETLYMYALLGESSTGYVYFANSQMSAPFEYNDENGTIAKFDTSVYDYLTFYAFTEKSLSGDTMAGSLATMFSPFLMKLDDAEAAKQQPTILKTMKFGK